MIFRNFAPSSEKTHTLYYKGQTLAACTGIKITGSKCTALLMLTFEELAWYLNFSAQFMKNILFEQKKVKL